MTPITIDDITFDDHRYDARGDVLYLSVGAPRHAASTMSTVEGHAVDYDENGRVIALMLVNVRWILANEGVVTVSWPAVRVEREQLEAALA